MRDLIAGAVLAVTVGGAVLLSGLTPPRAVAQPPAGIPETDGRVLVVSRCVICHSVEIAVQQRQGPLGWGEIIDRMVKYGMPLEPAEREVLVAYLVRHYGDPDGR